MGEQMNEILVILFFFFWNEYDFIIFQNKFSVMNYFLDEGSKFYTWYFTNNWQTNSWWLKNVFTMFLDGMHFVSSGFRFIGFYFASQLLLPEYALVSAIILYWLTGMIHSLMNETL